MTKLSVCWETDKQILHKNAIAPPKIISLTDDNQFIRSQFLFLKRTLNPQYEAGRIVVPLRSCLKHHKSDRKEWVIKTKPKWNTDLLQTAYNVNTGELIGQWVYSTDDLKNGNSRKIKAVNRFSDYFEPLYQCHKVSLFFLTLTIANQAKLNIKQLMDILKKRCKRNGVNVRGTLWITEVSKPELNKTGLHCHYHLILATDRINCKGGKLPDFLKLNNVWGARTQCGFVKQSVKYYLSSYFKKNNWRIEDKRSYGMSIKKAK